MAFWYLVMKGWRSLFMGKSSCSNWHISIHWFIIGLSSISPSPDCYFWAHHVVPHPNILFHTFDYTTIKSMNTSHCNPTLYLYILLECLFFYLLPIIVGEKTLFKTIYESLGKSTLFVVKSTKCWLNQHQINIYKWYKIRQCVLFPF